MNNALEELHPAWLFKRWCEHHGGSVTIDVDGIVRATVDTDRYDVGSVTYAEFNACVTLFAQDLRLLLTAPIQ